MMIAIGITEAVFLVAFVVSIVATWPDPPWTTILIAMLALNALVPVAIYPTSQTLWLAMERHVRGRLEPDVTDGRGDDGPGRTPGPG